MVDPKCLDLAHAFLSDHPDLDTPNAARHLAQVIQDTIDDEIALMEEDAKTQAPS